MGLPEEPEDESSVVLPGEPDMIFVYGFISLCAGLISIGCFWPAGPLVALASAPLTGSLAVLIFAGTLDSARRHAERQVMLWSGPYAPQGR